MKKVIKGIVLSVLAVIVFTGCQRSVKLPEPEIKAESSSLGAWAESLPKETETYSISGKSIRGMEIKADGEEIFAISYEPRTYKDSFDYWDISVPYESMVSVDTEKIYELFDAAAGIILQKVEQGTNEEQVKAAVENSGTRIRIAFDASQTDNGKGSAEPDRIVTLLVGGQNEKGDYYVGLEGDDTLYLAQNAIVDDLLNIEPFQYILKIPCLVNIDSVSDIELITEDKTYVMSKDGDNYRYQNRNVTVREYRELYSKLMSLLIEREMPDRKMAEKNRNPVLTMNFYCNEEAVSDIQMRFYEYNNKNLSVNVNGKEFFLVDKGAVEGLIKSID